MTTTVPEILLNNGRRIPQVGIGVFLIPPPETAAATAEALALGYRHIDTAQAYGNEAEVGEGLRMSGLDREDVFITSKIANRQQTEEQVLTSFEASLAALGIEQIDLMLIHWPLATVRDFTVAWRALEQVYRDGRARSIGVSNFQIHHLNRLFAETEVRPAVNQIEVHPRLIQSELRDFCAEHEIAIEAWSPLGRGAMLDDPIIATVAAQVQRTPAQVILRWHVQRGDIIFPKSSNPDRMRQNLALFDFELSDDQMADVSSRNRDERIGPDPDVFARVP